MKTIGNEGHHPSALTENSGGTEPAGTPLYVGIDAGRRHHVVVAIDRERMENGSWERVAARRVATWVLISDGECDHKECSEVRRTADGGATWAAQLSGPVRAIRFASSNQGWAVEEDGTPFMRAVVRATSDGGASWSAGFLAPYQFVGFDAASVTTAWLMTVPLGYCTASSCLNYHLYRSLDGGATWSDLGDPRPGGCGGHTVGPLFASQTTGWLGLTTGAGGAAYRTGLLMTVDGGRTWTCQAPPDQVVALTAADPAHLWVSSGINPNLPPQLYSTDDGGRTWQLLTLP